MTGLFSLTYGDIATSALIVCGIAALTTLAGRVVWYRIRVALDDHYYPAAPELRDEHADDVTDQPNEPFPADEAPELDEYTVTTEDTGRHSAVPPESPAEMTLYGGFTSAGGAL